MSRRRLALLTAVLYLTGCASRSDIRRLEAEIKAIKSPPPVPSRVVFPIEGAPETYPAASVFSVYSVNLPQYGRVEISTRGWAP